jgi:hypothetical protein
MDNFDQIKEVWISEKVNLPEAGDIARGMRSYRIGYALKAGGFLLLALLLLFIVAWLVFLNDAALLSTRIGQGCFVIALSIILSGNLRSLKKIGLGEDWNNQAYLVHLKSEYHALIRFRNSTQKAGFALASAGLLLYIYELVYLRPGWIIPGFSLALGWIALAWFVLRPAAFRNQTRNLLERIRKLEQISGQLNEYSKT